MFIATFVGGKEKITVPGCSFSQFCVTVPSSGLTGLFY